MVEADYILVGAGTAGCVLADRLSACGRFTVLLLEAGPSDRRLPIQVPIGYGMSFFNPAVNWMYRTEPEPALAGRSGYWPRGKVLGGSGSINAMVHVQGQPVDIADWARAGDSSWSVEALSACLERASQRIEGKDVSRDTHPICEAFMAAGGQAGFPEAADLSRLGADGIGHFRIATRNGLRLSSARAYLRPAMRRSNLVVEVEAHANRIGFDGLRAREVQFSKAGSARVARARREVILCAGSINSPKLLQLSGIGPGSTLKAHGITVLCERNGVGRNLQDHLCIDHLYRSRVPTLNQQFGSISGKMIAGLRYLLFRNGPLALSVNQAGGFVRSRPGLAAPNMQLYFSPLSYSRTPPGTRPLMRPDKFPGFLLSAQPCRPTSRGFLEIVSAEPAVAPRIVPNSLSTEHDVAELLEGARLLRQLAATPALRDVIETELMPGSAAQSDAEMLADIRQRASTVFHPVSTCRMGRDRETDVVDPSLRVHGVEGLRVVDASIFPSIPSGNTNAPTLMVAEKGAELILGTSAPR
ncbi:MAG: GMC family oxidoreductase N-terminal domain-containing protein [Methylobacterium sp.]|nr:GMC family oxidoreductase N-terminal domain-containing protein [Methylobacterium sp.]MCA3622392.1 GMC family oxidoreductase N-terminal domain-containing protein [Methylobacterium sp.]